MLHEVREIKPDVTGAAGVAVTGAGGFSNPFYGTSAAAPHIAAIAGLVWSKYPGKTAGEVKAYLFDSAADNDIQVSGEARTIMLEDPGFSTAITIEVTAEDTST
jgi:subtilisin family serine protease